MKQAWGRCGGGVPSLGKSWPTAQPQGPRRALQEVGGRARQGAVQWGKSCLPWGCAVCTPLGTALRDPRRSEDQSYWVPKNRTLG